MSIIDSDYYPEVPLCIQVDVLYQIVVLVITILRFKLIWNSVKGFLDPKTSSKIHVRSD
jgi:hypothetical protein